MFRMWGKIWKDNHLLKDTVVENDAKDTRTHKIFQALEEICYDFDLGKAHLALLQCVGVSAPQQNPFQKRQFYRGNSF